MLATPYNIAIAKQLELTDRELSQKEDAQRTHKHDFENHQKNRYTESINEKLVRHDFVNNVLKRSKTAPAKINKPEVNLSGSGKFAEVVYKKQMPIIGSGKVDMVKDEPMKDVPVKKSVVGAKRKTKSVEPKSELVKSESVKSVASEPVKTVKKRVSKKQPVNKYDGLKWTAIVSAVMKDEKLSMKKAIEHIKAHNLYVKKS